MIGYWHHPGVRLSVCDAVHCGSQGWCTAKSCTSRHVPLCPFRHFCCRMYRLACHKMHYKKRVEETDACISLYRLLTVQPHDLISTSRYTLGYVNLVKSRDLLTCPLEWEWICDCVQKRNSEIRFFRSSRSWAWNFNHLSDSSPGSICTWFCSYKSACIYIFIHRSRRCDHSEYTV